MYARKATSIKLAWQLVTWSVHYVQAQRPDHLATKEKPSSMHKTLTMYPAWDNWIMPRCEPIDEVYYEQPDKWSMTECDDIRGSVGGVPPLGFVQWEHQLLDRLSFKLNKGNLFRLWCESLSEKERAFWHGLFGKGISENRI